MHRPKGITVIVAVCFLSATWIAVVAILPRLIKIPFYLGIELSRPFQIGWPYLPVAIAIIWAVIGWGLLRLNNWARWAVILASVLGIASCLSYALVFSTHLGWWFLQIVLRAAVVWYLFAAPIAGLFTKTAHTK
jgi:hypothetical protein